MVEAGLHEMAVHELILEQAIRTEYVEQLLPGALFSRIKLGAHVHGSNFTSGQAIKDGLAIAKPIADAYFEISLLLGAEPPGLCHYSSLLGKESITLCLVAGGFLFGCRRLSLSAA